MINRPKPSPLCDLTHSAVNSQPPSTFTSPQKPAAEAAAQQQTQTPKTTTRAVADDNSIQSHPRTASKVVTPAAAAEQHLHQQQHVAAPVPSQTKPQKSLYASRYLLPRVPADTAAPLLTVALDLDETLVSNRDPSLPAAILRPYVLQALAAVRSIPRVEIVLWTASTEATAAPVVEQLGEAGFRFDAVITRSPLWFTDPVHAKDLRLLGRPMDRVVLFDNAPQCCKLNRANCVLVSDFFGQGGPEDCTLFNMVATIGHLVRDIVDGYAVPESLHGCALLGRQLGMVRYPLPKGFSPEDAASMPPLRVPVHGDFYKIHSRNFFNSSNNNNNGSKH